MRKAEEEKEEQYEQTEWMISYSMLYFITLKCSSQVAGFYLLHLKAAKETKNYVNSFTQSISQSIKY